MAVLRDEEETNLLDDSLEDLPADALNALEKDAVQATQRNQAPVNLDGAQPPEPTFPTLPLPHLHDAVPQDNGEPRRASSTPSSDYGNLDEDPDQLDVFESLSVHEERESVEAKLAGAVTQREQWRLQRYGQQHAIPHDRIRQAAPGLSAHDGPDPMPADPVTANAGPARGPPQDVQHLHAQLQQMRQEQELLRQSLVAAKETALARAGEVSIVRANQAKVVKEYERRITALQHLHANEATQQKSDLERAVAERERVATENKFLKQDLTEEGERVRNLRRNIQGGLATDKSGAVAVASNASPIKTPKKGKVLPYRDGFDDGEVVGSPSRRQSPRNKIGTPRAGAKRKRKIADDSPAPVLELSQPRKAPSVDVERRAEGAIDADILSQLFHREDGRFQPLHVLLNHRPDKDSVQTIEALSKFALPSNPTRSLSSVILDGLSVFREGQKTTNAPTELAQILLSLWESCIQETYYDPLHLIIDLLTFIFLHRTSAIVPTLVDSILPLAQTTADIIVIPRFRQQPYGKFAPLVDVTACLSLLYLVALGCDPEPMHIDRFWRLMRYDFIVMTLKSCNPIVQIESVVALLGTSVFDDTFGPIGEDEQIDQAARQEHQLDALTNLLIVNPRPSEGEQEYSKDDIADLRIQILTFLELVSNNKKGGKTMVIHSSAIGRIVSIMSSELDAVYDHRAGHEKSATLVNLSLRILHTLCTRYGGDFKLQDRLRAVPGGSHRHLVTLTRLAFSEGLVLEAGIADDVVEHAHSLLEDIVTPEEGEALLDAFASSR